MKQTGVWAVFGLLLLFLKRMSAFSFCFFGGSGAEKGQGRSREGARKGREGAGKEQGRGRERAGKGQ